jgi:hypothetical protein
MNTKTSKTRIEDLTMEQADFLRSLQTMAEKDRNRIELLVELLHKNDEKARSLGDAFNKSKPEDSAAAKQTLFDYLDSVMAERGMQPNG